MRYSDSECALVAFGLEGGAALCHKTFLILKQREDQKSLKHPVSARKRKGQRGYSFFLAGGTRLFHNPNIIYCIVYHTYRNIRISLRGL